MSIRRPSSSNFSSPVRPRPQGRQNRQLTGIGNMGFRLYGNGYYSPYTNSYIPPLYGGNAYRNWYSNYYSSFYRNFYPTYNGYNNYANPYNSFPSYYNYNNGHRSALDQFAQYLNPSNYSGFNYGADSQIAQYFPYFNWNPPIQIQNSPTLPDQYGGLFTWDPGIQVQPTTILDNPIYMDNFTWDPQIPIHPGPSVLDQYAQYLNYDPGMGTSLNPPLYDQMQPYYEGQYPDPSASNFNSDTTHAAQRILDRIAGREQLPVQHNIAVA